MAYSALTGLLLASSMAAANLPFHVDEGEIKIVLQENRTAVRLPLQNPTGRTLTASLELEWLTPVGVIVGHQNRVLNIPPGESQPVVAFPLSGAKQSRVNQDDKIWYRLRYRFRSEGAEDGGTLSLANLADHVFELQLSAPRQARPGTRYRAHVSARNAIFGTPVAGVLVRGNLDLEDGEIEAHGISDASGGVNLDFAIPSDAGGGEVEVAVEGILGDYSQTARADVTIDRGIQIRIDTDKPLYQPGQTLHIRILARLPARAAAALPLTLRIEDPERTAAHIARVVTDRFGVAAVDWPIPENTRLGNYQIRTSADGEDADARAFRTVSISRYDLPNFAVTVRPDRPYYLPGQKRRHRSSRGLPVWEARPTRPRTGGARDSA